MKKSAVVSPIKEITKSVWIRAGFLVLLTIAAYLPALQGGFIWDDDKYLTGNALLTAPDGLRRIWFSFDAPSQYFPLVYTTFRIEHALWGFNPLGYHIVNLVLHITNALLVWRLLVRLGIPGAWLAAGIFALHPVQVESVAWMTERKNVLMGLFFLLTLQAWITFLDERTNGRVRFYVLTLAFYSLALFSKATACVLPAALLLILWWQQKPITPKRLVQIIPFIALALLMGLVVIWCERYHQGTSGALFAYGILDRLLIASRSLWFYAGKLVWPAKLTFIYPGWNVVSTDLLAYGWLVLALGAGAVIFVVRRYVGRGIETGVVFYVATLSPLLGFIMAYTFRYTFVADHYQYLASIGLIALAAAGLTNLAVRWQIRRQVQIAFAALLFLLLGGLTWQQAHAYQSLETLWNDTLKKNPTCWMAYNNLGLIYYQAKRVDEAISQYERSLEINPDNVEAHNNLGNALRQKGSLNEAIVHYQKALTIKPDFAEAENNLGNSLLQKGEVDDAIVHYQMAVKLRADSPAFQWNLGRTLAGKHRFDEAIPAYQAVLRMQPNNAEAHRSLAMILAVIGKSDEAIKQFNEALRIKPNYPEAEFNLGCALVEFGQREEGVAHLKEALRLKPDHVKARQQLRALGITPAE
jgi:tetratricopeptide (TPR) repeat protein